MALTIRTKLESNTRQFEASERAKIRMAFRELSKMILKDARLFAPELSGDLKRSGRTYEYNGVNQVIFGSAKVPYAALRHEINFAHPNTRFYLKKAIDADAKASVVKRLMKGL